jgi:hypothetical protein
MEAIKPAYPLPHEKEWLAQSKERPAVDYPPTGNRRRRQQSPRKTFT